MPGLPNAVSQEMDYPYGTFKGDTDAKTEEIFERKTYERAKLVEQLKDTPNIQIPVAHLTNDNIPEIIGKHEDAIKDQPFAWKAMLHKTSATFFAKGAQAKT